LSKVASDILATARFHERIALDEREAKRLLAAYGVPVVREVIAGTPEQAGVLAAEIGFPCVLKVLSPDIAHKTEVGGVRLDIGSPEQAAAAAAEILDAVGRSRPDAKLAGLLLQRQEPPPAAELLIGVTRDPVFGLVMTVGLGGVLTELYQDVAQRLLPVDADTALQMLRELRSWPLLSGYRGRPLADVEAACKAIVAVSDAARALGTALQELEINPLILHAAGSGAVAVDALVVLAAA
jgi:succinyl-CoA synthetase beta subunit